MNSTASTMAEWPSRSDGYDPYTFDLDYYSHLLQENSSRLFAQEDAMKIKIIEIGEQEMLVERVQVLENYLRTSTFNGIRLIFVPQRFSWDHLMISERAMRTLLSHFKAFPAIMDVVNGFGGQTSSESDSASECHSYSRNGISELSYIVKHVEEHGRESSDDPWSIRQMGVYHQQDHSSDCSTFIILNPSKNFQRRLRDTKTMSGSLPTWKDIHKLLTSCSTVAWKRYISYHESQISKLKTKAHLSTVIDRTSNTRPTLKVEFSDTQNLQIIHDKLHRVNHILATNLQDFHAVSSLMGENMAVKKEESSLQSGPKSNEMLFCINETEMQARRLNMLFQRINATSGLMQNIIDFRGLEALKNSSEMSTEIAQLAQSDNKLMLQNAERSQKDARTITIITIFTMIYLPASFVSQFLSMGYIALGHSKSHVSVVFSGEMWIFGIMTLLLLVVTWGTWLWLELRARRRKSDCESKAG